MDQEGLEDSFDFKQQTASLVFGNLHIINYPLVIVYRFLLELCIRYLHVSVDSCDVWSL